jgi:hypothetical protein
VFGVRKVHGAAAGLDVENPEPIVFGRKLVEAVEAGAVEPRVIDQACRRILTTQFRFAAAADPLEAYTPDLVARPAHVAVALEAAEKSAVLLTNDGILPLRRESVRSVAVLGRLAAMENTGDFGSSRVRPPYVVTPLQGLQTYLANDASVVAGDESDLDAAGRAAAQADVVVVVVGYTAKEEGEFIPGDIALEGMEASEEAKAGQSSVTPTAVGGDRRDLGLPADQLGLIDAACASGKPVIVVVVAGSAVLMEGWVERPSAILQTFYSGMEGGTALARLLFGEVSPSGKLPFTQARSEADYPFYDIDADQHRVRAGPRLRSGRSRRERAALPVRARAQLRPLRPVGGQGAPSRRDPVRASVGAQRRRDDGRRGGAGLCRRARTGGGTAAQAPARLPATDRPGRGDPLGAAVRAAGRPTLLRPRHADMASGARRLSGACGDFVSGIFVAGRGGAAVSETSASPR